MSDWVMFYYAAPSPERFVDETRRLLAASPPERELVVGKILGRVMTANPALIPAWIRELQDLPEPAAAVLRLAAWLSDTPEGRAAVRNDSRFASSSGPSDVLTLEIQDATQLDVLWAWYFATGEVRAVARIVSALRWMSCFGAAAAYEQSAKTAEDRARAVHDAIFQAASWSLQSLMQQHPPLKRLCEGIFDAPDLDPTARVALALALEKVDPSGWRVLIDPTTSRATIQRRP